MNKRKINGSDFEGMVRNGLNYLRRNERAINDMNVFPVPDGDTGTNMRLTLENGISAAASDKSLCVYLRELSRGMLFGARGNSGVILSQLFKGLYSALKSEDKVNASELFDGFVGAYKVAYGAVVNPAEGTLLTVAREGIENIRSLVTENTTVEELLRMYLAAMKESLEHTPELLPVLGEAGVLDSGGYGYIVIAEGMLKYLDGEFVPFEGGGASAEPVAAPAALDYSLFDADSKFEFGYCMEFLLQLLSERTNIREFDIAEYISGLRDLGESIVAIADGSRVKVHIHTFEPARVIEYSQRLGEFVAFKLENMCLQNKNERKKKEAHLPFAIISVGNGAGVKALFDSFKNVFYVEGGPTMNTSAKDFIDMFMSVYADRIVVLPNNPNVIRSAEQAIELFGKNNVEIIPTRSIVEGYYALAMNTDDGGSFDARVDEMRKSIDGIVTLSVSVATRHCSLNGHVCERGDYIAVVNGQLAYASVDAAETVANGLKCVDGLDEKEMCVIVKGKDCSDAMCEQIRAVIERDCPDLTVEVLDGGQEIYSLIIGLA